MSSENNSADPAASSDGAYESLMTELESMYEELHISSAKTLPMSDLETVRRGLKSDSLARVPVTVGAIIRVLEGLETIKKS